MYGQICERGQWRRRYNRELEELYNKPNMLIYLTAIGLTPGGSSTVHIYTKTIHRTTQLTTSVGRFSRIRTQSGQTKINDELNA